MSVRFKFGDDRGERFGGKDFRSCKFDFALSDGGFRDAEGFVPLCRKARLVRPFVCTLTADGIGVFPFAPLVGGDRRFVLIFVSYIDGGVFWGGCGGENAPTPPFG